MTQHFRLPRIIWEEILPKIQPNDMDFTIQVYDISFDTVTLEFESMATMTYFILKYVEV